ncbi:hypothetical protein [Streptomyces sp. NPDC093568]|uniref:hypothetical protein n=1 Tax=Streptomyces sp. NPDC093568 TaxID=3366041 RepID=UPI003824C839
MRPSGTEQERHPPRRVTPAPALGLAALLAAAPAGASTGGRYSYGTKATYAPGQNPRSHQRPPAGFTPVFTENVSRHGSRAATDGEDADLVLALWKKAGAAGRPRARGKQVGPRVQALRSAMRSVGNGDLSGRGKRRNHPLRAGRGRRRLGDAEPPSTPRARAGALRPAP